MTNVYGTMQIGATAFHVKNGTPNRTALTTIHTEHRINCIQVSGSLRQMDVAACVVQSGQAGCHVDLSYT